MYRGTYGRAASILFVLLLVAVPVFAADPARKSIRGSAEATLQKDRNGLYLITRSKSFQLAQFAYGGRVNTVLVEGEVAHRLLVSEDLGTNGDETGTVKLTIRPIDSNGQFGVPLAERKTPGDEIRLDSPAGVTVISYGCCQESNAETLLSLADLKTLYVHSSGARLTTYTQLGKPALGRVIAVYLAMTPEDEAVLGSDQSAVGMITLEGEGRVLQRIRVLLRGDKPREAALGWSIGIGWKTASGALDNHTVIDPAKPSRPIFVWKIGESQTIELPLIDDRLDLVVAKLPEGVTLKMLPH